MPVTFGGEASWHGTFPTFPRANEVMGQLAIHAKDLESAPVLMLADGTAIPMLRVPATELWIENGEWPRDRRKGQDGAPKWPRVRKASLNAKAGRVQIRIAQDNLDLELSPADWSWDGVLQLERDLHATALELVLDRKSAASATDVAERLTGSLEKLKAALETLAEQCEKIARSPIRELRSNVVPVRAHRAKPCHAGLIDLVRRPGASHLRSRVTQESIDCPENRYIAFLQHRCELVLRLCQTALEQRRETHQHRLGDLQHQFEAMPETAPVSVNISAEDVTRERIAIQRHLNRIESGAFNQEEYSEWLLEENVKYSERGLLKYILNKQLNALDGLAGMTTRSTTDGERQEYRRGRDAMLSQLSQLRAQVSQLVHLGQEFVTLERRIQAQLLNWKSFGVQPSPSAPTSVALRTNMPYAKALAAYGKVRSAFRDETTMTALFSTSCVLEHGLVDLNLLYERWCTLQVVRVILGLGFEPDREEALGLVARTLVTRRDLRTDQGPTFIRGAVSLSVQMEPAMKTVDGGGAKYPDLVIRIDGGAQEETVVLDVKCHEFAESRPEVAQCRTTLPSSSKEIRKMYFGPSDGGERNYSMGGQNRVFLLHPCRGGIPEPSSIQPWSAKSFYGERYIYDWQNDDAGPDHRYGAVYLRPGELDDLRRLLGMLLNMATLPQLRGEIKSEYQSATRCFQCGRNLKWKETFTHKGIPKYQCTCGSCGEYYVFTHCWLCKRRLVKCGMYWSYHSLAGQIGNVSCPRCGTSLPKLDRASSEDIEALNWGCEEGTRSWYFSEPSFQPDEDELGQF
jgi:hypothetical protein